VGEAPVDVVSGGQRLYVANWNDNTVSVVDLLAGSVVQAVAVGQRPTGLALHHATKRLYVANFLGDTVSVIDTTTLSVIASVPVARRPRGLVVDQAAGRVYVAGFDDAVIDVIDTATNTVLFQAPSGGVNPMDLMLGPGGQRLYVAHLATGQPVRVLDAATLAPLAAIDCPDGPVALAGFANQAPPVSAQEGRMHTGLRLDPARATLVSGRRAPRQPQAPADVVIADTEFNPVNWEVLAAHGPQTTTQQLSGGNPGAWRRTIHGSPGAVEAVHRYVGGAYDATDKGAIATIDASWDRRADGDHMVQETFVLVQHGVVYATSPDSFFNFGWATRSRVGLTAADFSDAQGGHPDFTPFASPTTFGYARGTDSDFDAEHGIDNFSVTVHAVSGPTPGVLAFRDAAAFVGSGGTLPVVVERLGGTLGTVSATLFTDAFDCVPDQVDLTWADGDDAPQSVPVVCTHASEGVLAFRFDLVGSAGTVVHPDRWDLAVAVAPADWGPALLGLGVFFQTLLSGLSPAWVLALAVPALLALRRRRRRAG